MSQFSTALTRAALNYQSRVNRVFVNFVGAVKDSIQNGSPITGAPGQPVDKGNLRDSWQAVHESPTSAVVMTDAPYARPNEDGVTDDGRPYVQRTSVGGRHSVKLTVGGASRLLEHVVREERGA